ncbi:MAG: TetR/AcrR family transcriptional regulator [Acutalibacteraceae bacterium]
MNQTEKTQRSIDMIINAAIPEFAEKGFEGAVLNDICRKNNISKGRLFHHFSGKGELYLACCKRAAEDLAANNLAFEPDRSKTPQQNMHDYLLHRNTFYAKDICRTSLLRDVQRNEIPAFKSELSETVKICHRANVTALRRIFDESKYPLPEKSFKVFAEAFYISQSYVMLNGVYRNSFSGMSEAAIKGFFKETADAMDMIMDIILFGIYPRDGSCPERMPVSDNIKFDVLDSFADIF